MNNKIFSRIGYLAILILSILIRILYPYEVFEDIIIDVIIFSGGIFIYKNYKKDYLSILYSLFFISMIHFASLWLRFFFRILFIDDNIMTGIMYIIIDMLKVICLVLTYSKLCENIKFMEIKKYIVISILLCFIITIVPLVRITFINEFLLTHYIREVDFWIEILKRSSLIMQDFIKLIIIIVLANGIKSRGEQYSFKK